MPSPTSEVGAGEERMARGADVNAQFRLRGTGLERVAAGAANRAVHVFGMDVFLHGFSFAPWFPYKADELCQCNTITGKGNRTYEGFTIAANHAALGKRQLQPHARFSRTIPRPSVMDASRPGICSPACTCIRIQRNPQPRWHAQELSRSSTRLSSCGPLESATGRPAYAMPTSSLAMATAWTALEE